MNQPLENLNVGDCFRYGAFGNSIRYMLISKNPPFLGKTDIVGIGETWFSVIGVDGRPGWFPRNNMFVGVIFVEAISVEEFDADE